MKTTTYLHALLIILIGLYGCEDEDNRYEDQVRIDKGKIEKYLADNDISAEEARGGYYYQILKENTDGEGSNLDYAFGNSFRKKLAGAPSWFERRAIRRRGAAL